MALFANLSGALCGSLCPRTFAQTEMRKRVPCRGWRRKPPEEGKDEREEEAAEEGQRWCCR
jgi:hypothetical protein